MRRLLLWTLLGLAVFSPQGCIRQDGGDRPSPPPVPEQVDAGLQARVFDAMLMEDFEWMAIRLETETITQYQMWEQLQAKTSESRKQAFTPLFEEMDKLKGESWDQAKAAALLRKYREQIGRRLND